MSERVDLEDLLRRKQDELRSVEKEIVAAKSQLWANTIMMAIGLIIGVILAAVVRIVF